MYASVRITNKAGLFTVFSSDGAQVDITPPECTINLEAFTSNGPRLPLSWNCADDESGIARVRVALGHTRGQSNVVDWTETEAGGLVPFLDNMLVAAGPELGKEYHVTVEALNVAGKQSFFFSVPVVYDTTKPDVQVVLDGTNPTDDSDYGNDAKKFSASWYAGDDETPIVVTELAVGSTPGGEELMAFTELVPPECVPSDMDSDPCITAMTSVTDMSLPDGATFVTGSVYYITVRVTNAVALSNTGTSDGFLVDLTPPVCEYVRDSHDNSPASANAPDVDFLQTLSVLRGRWSCSDDDTGLAGTEWGVKEVGQSGTPAMVLDYHSAKGGFQAATTNVDVKHGAKYLWSVRATNAAGLEVEVDSDGVTIDATPPEAGIVLDVADVSDPTTDIQFTFDTVSLAAAWDGFADPESGIVSYTIGFGSLPGNDDIMAFRNVGTATSFRRGGLFLDTFGTYYATVRAASGAGGWVEAVSNGVTTDATPPVPGIVAMGVALPDGFSDQATYPASVTGAAFEVSWVNFRDVESKIVRYEVAIGTGSGTTVSSVESVHSFSSVGNVFAVTIDNLAVTHDTTYFVTVRAINSVGLSVSVTSPPHTVLLGDVIPGVVTDGAFADDDVDYQESVTSVWAHWHSFSDPAGGTLSYLWQISPSKVPAASDWTEEGLAGAEQVRAHATSASALESVDLVAGIKYYVHVKATSSATGTWAVATSDGFVADNTAPDIVSVRIGQGDTHLAFTPLPVWASWDVVEDGAPLVKYEVAFGTMAGATNILDFTDVQKAQAYLVKKEVASFVPGAALFATLRVTNAAQLVSVKSSEVSVVDVTPPLAGYVDDGGGIGEDMDLDVVGVPNGDMTISARWKGWLDGQSPVDSFRWCVGTTEGGCDVLPMESVGGAFSASRVAGQWWKNVEEDLADGEQLRYYTTVEGCNAVGLCQTSVSNGVTVDLTDPVAGNVNHGLVHNPFLPSDPVLVEGVTNLAFAFGGFEDPESEIVMYVHHARCAASWQLCADVNSCRAMTTFQVRVGPGRRG